MDLIAAIRSLLLCSVTTSLGFAQVNYEQHFKGAIENEFVDIRTLDWQIHERHGAIPPMETQNQTHTLQFGESADGDSSFFRRTTSFAVPYLLWTNTVTVAEQDVAELELSWNQRLNHGSFRGDRVFVHVRHDGVAEWFAPDPNEVIPAESWTTITSRIAERTWYPVTFSGTLDQSSSAFGAGLNGASTDLPNGDIVGIGVFIVPHRNSVNDCDNFRAYSVPEPSVPYFAILLAAIQAANVMRRNGTLSVSNGAI